MTISRIDPWTALRMSFLLSLAVAVITIVAVVLLWSLLAVAGVFTSLNSTINDVVGAGSFSVTQYFGLGRVLTFAIAVAVIDVVLITAVATLAALLYNLAASLVGGIEVSVVDEG